MAKAFNIEDDVPESARPEATPEAKPFNIEDEPPPPEQRPAPSWAEIPGQALLNAPQSAYNTAASMAHPFLHPQETVENIGNIGAGVMEKLGMVEGNAHVKYADAVGEMLYNRWGSIDNIKRSLAEDPVGMAADISMLLSGGETALARMPGALGKVGEVSGTAARVLDPIGTTASYLPRKVLGIDKQAHLEAPDTAEHFAQADKDYADMRALPIEINKNATGRIADNIKMALRQDGYRDYHGLPDGALFSAVDELRNPANGITSKMADIEGVRRALNRIAKNPELRDGARLAQKHIDGFLSNLHPTDVINNPHLAPELNRLANSARGNYAAGSRSEIIDDAIERAHLGTGATGTAGNIDNKMRQEIKRIIFSDKLSRGFSKEEKAAMKDFVTHKGGVARLVGKFAPQGVVSSTLGAELGYHALGASGIPVPAVIGWIGKKIADYRTAKRLENISQMVRTRSPLAGQHAAYNRLMPQPTQWTNAPLTATRTARTLGRLPTQLTVHGDYPPEEARGGRISRALRTARKH